jgi:glyoxylase-like metal-dependent hydrolase (beta-lactamase superfamily II)
MRLHPRILQIGTDWGDGGHTKLHLIEGEQKAIIDTGERSSPKQDIAPYLAMHGYTLDDIEVIINTHGHHDHAGGNPGIPKAQVWMHEADVFMVEDPGAAFDEYNGPFLKLMGKNEGQVQEERTKNVTATVKQKVSRVLKDGDIIDLGKGMVLKVVTLPGHSRGSIGYLFEKEGMLFIGDAAMGQGSRPGVLPVLTYPLSYAATLQKLLGMEFNMLSTGHYYQALRVNSNPVKKGDQIRLYLEDCQEINNWIMECVARNIHRYWEAPFPVVMSAAVEEIAQRLFLRRDPTTGLPRGAASILGAYYLDIKKAL